MVDSWTRGHIRKWTSQPESQKGSRWPKLQETHPSMLPQKTSTDQPFRYQTGSQRKTQKGLNQWMVQLGKRKEDAWNRQFDTVKQVHQVDQQPRPLMQHSQHNCTTKNHGYATKQLPQTLQKDRQQQMSSMQSGKWEHFPLLTHLSKLRSRKMALTQISKKEKEASHTSTPS